LKKLKKNHKI